jgi:uncharacterized SAM-binding protein YcdF (DUF218 family)
MFILKKIIGIFVCPEVIILILLSLGLLRMILAKNSKRSEWFLFSLATISFYLFTTAPLPNALSSLLENQYSPIQEVKDLGKIDYIVILSGDRVDNLKVPPTSRVGAVTAARVVEGIRLFHLFSNQPTLIMSGGGTPSGGDMMVAFARSLDVPSEKLVAETNSLDTYGNAKEVKIIIKDAPFLLVTSANHLPRAMTIFNALCMRPIPAPADFRMLEKFSWSDFFPQTLYLGQMRGVVHEYLGLGYLKFFPKRAGK